ncbi:hypothetical protein QFC19_007852 [Naganishia cerealis]|uniref:Uncharacterized protein n=1 Tax=Naganishia cerealis TaxID=610337 RepID=A0ACC2V650_9TREE|nr:hypothetical protein QFC19_007852 [Naganishia cerealis]
MSTPTATNGESSEVANTPLGANTALKAVIKSVDMEKSMEEKAIELAQEAMNKFTMEKDMAEYLKREFDRLYSTTWHCVVGKK